MDNYLREDELKGNVKEKLKQIYKDIVIEDIKEEVLKSKNELVENINKVSENKKINKDLLNKLDQLLIMVDILQDKEEKDLKSIAFNNKIVLISNIILAILLFINLFI